MSIAIVLMYFFFVIEAVPVKKVPEESQHDENDEGEQSQPRRGLANRLLLN